MNLPVTVVCTMFTIPEVPVMDGGAGSGEDGGGVAGGVSGGDGGYRYYHRVSSKIVDHV